MAPAVPPAAVNGDRGGVRAVPRAAVDRDRGAVLVEFSAVFPIALVVILFAFEALMASTTVERVENAARTGARTASQQQNPGACRGAALDALPDWLSERSVDGGPSGEGVRCHVHAKVPLLWPGAPLGFTVDRTVEMPLG